MIGGYGLIGNSLAGHFQLAGSLFVGRDVVNGVLGVGSGKGGRIQVGQDDEILLQGLDEGTGGLIVEVTSQEEGLACAFGQFLDEAEGLSLIHI